MKPTELREITNKVNKKKNEKNNKIKNIVDLILEKAKMRAESGEYYLNVDEWCGDYVPLAGEVHKELEKRGYTVYTGGAYTYYISWK